MAVRQEGRPLPAPTPGPLRGARLRHASDPKSGRVLALDATTSLPLLPLGSGPCPEHAKLLWQLMTTGDKYVLLWPVHVLAALADLELAPNRAAVTASSSGTLVVV